MRQLGRQECRSAQRQCQRDRNETERPETRDREAAARDPGVGNFMHVKEGQGQRQKEAVVGGRPGGGRERGALACIMRPRRNGPVEILGCRGAIRPRGQQAQEKRRGPERPGEASLRVGCRIPDRQTLRCNKRIGRWCVLSGQCRALYVQQLPP